MACISSKLTIQDFIANKRIKNAVTKRMPQMSYSNYIIVPLVIVHRQNGTYFPPPHVRTQR